MALTWEQAFTKAHQQQIDLSGINSEAAKKLGLALLDAENMAHLLPKTTKPMYTSKTLVRAATMGATAKDLERVIATCNELLTIIREQETRSQQAADITAQLYNVWSACPNGQTFQQFLEDL